MLPIQRMVGMGIAFWLATSAAFAQPVLDVRFDMVNIESDWVLNNASQIRRADSLAIESKLGAHSWKYDFASVRTQPLILYPYTDQYPSAANYPTANYVLSGDADRALYYRRDGDAVFQIGDYITATETNDYWKPGLPVVPFFLEYTKSKIFGYRRTLVFDPLLTFRTQISDTVTYLGYGELTLNGNYYDTVAVIRHSRFLTDTSGRNPRRDKFYHFLIRDLGYPLLSVTYNQDGSGQIQFVNQENIIVSVRPRTSLKLAFSPNPSHREVNIAGALATEKTARFISVTGLVAERPLSRGLADITGLAPGVYTVQVGSRKGRLVVE